MSGWWQDLMDLVVPSECAGCGRPRTVLCAHCRAALLDPAPRRVRPIPEPPGLPMVHAAAPYEDAVRGLLLAHKERGALALAAPLGRALAGAARAGLRLPTRQGGDVAQGRGAQTAGSGARVREAGVRVPGGGTRAGQRAGDDRTARCRRTEGQGRAGRSDHAAWPRGRTAPASVVLVPVPSAPWAVRARGHDPVRRTALAAAVELRRSGVPARVLTALRQRREVADQSGLAARQRRANLAGALGVAAAAGGLLRAAGQCVLVDDLVTTGASLAEGARALREAGVERGISAAVVAAAPGCFVGPGADREPWRALGAGT